MTKKNTQKKKFYTLDDLYNFFLTKNTTCNFSSEESGYPLSIQVPAQFDISDDVDDTLLFCTVKLMHSGENRNHSSVTDEALVKASKNLAYKPILANFMEYVDEETGETLKDFTSHDMEINEDGSVTYLEKQVGCFTADEPYFRVEKETGHNFLYGTCAIPREYTDTVSIIERKNGTKISVELAINEMSFNASTKVLELTDVVILGATLLGKNPKTLADVGEGMKNARLDISDFSTKNNSLFSDYQSQMIEFQERLEKLETACFNKDQNLGQENIKEGGNETNMNKFEELLAKYGKTAEDITFDYAELSDKELEAKFEELFGEDGNGADDVNTSNDDGSGDEPSDNDEGDSTADPEEGTDSNDDGGEDSGEGEGSATDEGVTQEQFERMTRSYDLSHDDIRYALYVLLAPYEEANNDYYWIMEVFDTYFVYQGYTGQVYGQKYTKDGDNVAFDGERYELFLEYLTESEKTTLADMRSNYSSIVDELNAYKSAEVFADKMTVFEDEAYTDYLETDEFKALMSEETVNQFSKEELAEKADATLGKLVKKNKTFSFAATETKKRVNRVAFNVEKETEDTYKPYGDLFDE